MNLQVELHFQHTALAAAFHLPQHVTVVPFVPKDDTDEAFEQAVHGAAEWAYLDWKARNPDAVADRFVVEAAPDYGPALTQAFLKQSPRQQNKSKKDQP